MIDSTGTAETATASVNGLSLTSRTCDVLQHSDHHGDDSLHAGSPADTVTKASVTSNNEHNSSDSGQRLGGNSGIATCPARNDHPAVTNSSAGGSSVASSRHSPSHELWLVHVPQRRDATMDMLMLVAADVAALRMKASEGESSNSVPNSTSAKDGGDDSDGSGGRSDGQCGNQDAQGATESRVQAPVVKLLHVMTTVPTEGTTNVWAIRYGSPRLVLVAPPASGSCRLCRHGIVKLAVQRLS